MANQKKEKKSWQYVLPDGATAEIHKKLKGKVSLRSIQRIVKGQQADLHGVLELAEPIAKKWRAKKEKEQKQLTLLKMSQQ